jgi:hypothetical protein
MVAACLAGLLLPGSASARTEGPYRGQVVDEETGAPLAGVVVVAYYEKKSPGWVHNETEFYDLDETVADAQGRFFLAARSLPISTPLSHVVGPIFIFFKGGYKSWWFQGVEYGEHVDMGVRDEQLEEAWRKFRNRESVVILKARAKTRDERTWEIGTARPMILREGPAEGRAPLLQKALDEEDVAIRNLR